MTEHLDAEVGGQRYIWNGRRWQGAEDHQIPPKPVLQSLNRLRKRAGRSTDQSLTDPGKLIALAVGARAAGDPGRAERLARRVLSIEPGNGIAAAIVSSILRQKGNPRRALAIVDHFRASNDPPVLTSRAAALCDLRRWDEALEQIREVLAIETRAYGTGSDEALAVLARIKGNAWHLFAEEGAWSSSGLVGPSL